MVRICRETITINTPSWYAVAITDGDSEFKVNDGSQTLNRTQTIGGISVGGGMVVEAEYGIVITDRTDRWTLAGFNVSSSSPSYAPIEGLAVIGGPGGFPPSGVPLAVTSNFEAQKVRWIAAREVLARGSFAAVRFAAGCIGNAVPLPGSQQHRVPLEGWRAELWVGAQEVLVTTHHLINGCDVVLAPGGMLTYYHVLLDQHVVPESSGA